MRVLAKLEALRDQVRDEILKDPRYLTYQALERSIREIRAALEGAGPAGRYELGPLGRRADRSAGTAIGVAGATDRVAAKPNGSAFDPRGDIIHPHIGHAARDATDAGEDVPVAAGKKPTGELAGSVNGREPHGRPLTPQVDSEAMANLQHALIDLINGDHAKGCAPADDRTGRSVDTGAAAIRHACGARRRGSTGS